MMKEYDPINLYLAIQGDETGRIPEGYKTTNQWGELWKKSNAQANRILRKGVEMGLVEQKKFIVKCGSCVKRIPHYKDISKNPFDFRKKKSTR